LQVLGTSLNAIEILLYCYYVEIYIENEKKYRYLRAHVCGELESNLPYYWPCFPVLYLLGGYNLSFFLFAIFFIIFLNLIMLTAAMQQLSYVCAVCTHLRMDSIYV